MRNTIYLCVILLYILHNVNSRKHNTRELNPNSEKQTKGDKLNMSNFVDMLIRDAKKIATKRNEHKPSLKTIKIKKKKKSQEQTTKKNEPITEKDGFESNYDTLGVDDENTNKIVRSHNDKSALEKIGEVIRIQNEGVDLNLLADILHSNNVAIDYKKMGQILRSSNSGLDFKMRRPVVRSKDDSDERMQEGQVFRSVDKPNDEDETELLFDLENEDELTHPLF